MKNRWPDAVYEKFNVATLSDAELDFIDKLFKNLTIRDSCWIRGTDPFTYTTIRYKGKVQGAHRVSYELLTGNRLIYQGCHRCDIPACINSDHIFDGTQGQNTRDAIRKGRIDSDRLTVESQADSREKRRIIHEHQMGRSAFPAGKIEIRKEIKPIPPLELMSRLKKLLQVDSL